MATKSIFKNVVIKDKKLGENFISALENAHKKVSQEVKLTKPYEEVKGEKIKDLLGDLD